MELFNYYSLDECLEKKIIKKRLSKLEDEGKIEFEIEGEVLKLTDLDLDENEVVTLGELFDKYDVFPYPDYEEGMDDEEDDYYDDFNDEDDY